MEKKKKIVLIVVAVIIVLLIVLGVFLSNKYVNSEDYAESKLKYHLSTDGLKLDICKKSDCQYDTEHSYLSLSLDYKIDLLQNEVEKMNKETERLYKEDNASSTSDSACSKVKNIYNKRYFHDNNFNVYENDEYIFISVSRTKTDVCTSKSISDQVNTKIYDKNTKKIISQEEFIKANKINKSEVIDTINKSLDISNKYYSTEYSHYDETFTDYSLFYLSIGDLIISYKLPGDDGYNTANFINVNKGNNPTN